MILRIFSVVPTMGGMSFQKISIEYPLGNEVEKKCSTKKEKDTKAKITFCVFCASLRPPPQALSLFSFSHPLRIPYSSSMPAFSDFVERMIIPFEQGELIKKPIVSDGNEWPAKNRIDEANDDQMFGPSKIENPAAAAVTL